MSSTYSTSLRLELMATGDQSGTWGDTTNTNLGTLLEQAITGYLSVSQGDVANLTLTTVNGGTDQARNAVVNITGALTAARNVVVQTAAKLYLIRNSTTGGFVITAKTAAGTGVEIGPNTARWVYSDGTNVVDGLPGVGYGYATTATAAGTTTLTVGSPATQFFTGSTTQTLVLPVASTLALGQTWRIVNASTGAVTINSSGGNLVGTLPAASQALVVAILTSGTTAASWSYQEMVSLTGAQTLTNKTLSAPVWSGSGTGTLSMTGSSVGYTAFQAISTEAAAAAGPIIELYRNSASPAAADILGDIDFNGQNSSAAKTNYAQILGRITTTTAGAENSALQVNNMIAGVLSGIAYFGRSASGAGTATAVGLPQGQLSFPATQNASSDANTLDDYEEGTWTPAVTFGGASVGITYTTQTGTYTKVGNQVTVNCTVTLSSKGSSTGAAGVSGLPFSAATAGAATGAVSAGSLTGLTVGGLVASINTTTISFRQSVTTGTASVADTNFTNTTNFQFAMSYLV